MWNSSTCGSTWVVLRALVGCALRRLIVWYGKWPMKIDLAIYIYICIHPSTAPPSTYMFDRRPETAWGFARGEGFGSFLLVQARTLIPVLNGGFHKWVYPENGWFIMENPSINGWFRGTPIYGMEINHLTWEYKYITNDPHAILFHEVS